VEVILYGSDLAKGLIRWIKIKRHGSKEIEMSSDLEVAVASGLIRVGSEIFAGYQSECEGTEISRFAIPPEILGEKLGTRMKVLSINRKVIILKPIGLELYQNGKLQAQHARQEGESPLQ